MFGSLPPTEKQAFFTILDEYFESRPHLLSALQGEPHPSPSPLAAKASPPPAPAPRKGNPPAPAARKPSLTASSPTRNGPAVPAGLSSGKTFAGIKTSSASAAVGSMLDNKRASKREPVTAGDAIRGVHAVSNLASRLNLGNNSQSSPPAAAAAAAAAPPPPAPAATPDLGRAEALYDYRGTEGDDLSVRQYDIVTLLEKVNDDWWRAQATDGSGRSGLVPSSYVRVL